jgi:hypothetical protein
MSWHWNAGCFLGLVRAIAFATLTTVTSCPVQVSARNIRLDGTVGPTWELPGPESLILEECAPTDSAKGNSFVVTGRGGVPPSPDEPLSPETVWVDWAVVKSSALNESKPNFKVKQNALSRFKAQDKQAIPPQSPPAIAEAQTWVRNTKGEIYLVATLGYHHAGLIPLTCK